MGKGAILIVEDDNKMRYALRHILSKEGYCVKAVASGEEALSEARDEDFELVITDLKLPGMDGMDVLKSVRASKPHTSVVMVTAYATVDSAVEAMKEGAEDYVAKPFNIEEIRVVVRRVFEKRGSCAAQHVAAGAVENEIPIRQYHRFQRSHGLDVQAYGSNKGFPVHGARPG